MKKARPTKLNLQSIAMFEYYTKQLFPSLIRDYDHPPKAPTQLKTTYRNISYHYISDVVPGFTSLQPSALLTVAKNLYLLEASCKSGQHKGLKISDVHLKLVPISTKVHDEIDLVVLTHKKEEQENIQRYNGGHSTKNPFEVRIQSKDNSNKTDDKQKIKARPHPDYSIYVIHTSKPNFDSPHPLEWLNFIQKYYFTIPHQDEEVSKPVVFYQAVISYNTEGQGFINMNSRLLQTYFQQSCPISYQGKSLMLRQLINQLKKIFRNQIKKLQMQIQIASQNPCHRRELQLNLSQKKLFDCMKPNVYQYFQKINPTRQVNPRFLDNTICRIMDNNNYDPADSWQALQYYFDTEKRLREQYCWQDFAQYASMNIFNYIGKDNMGRPILLNRVRNCLLSRITDRDHFFDYHFYVFEIYLQDQMEGWVDQFDVLVDGADQVNDNTDIMFTRKILFEIFKLTIGRPRNLIGCNVGILGRMLAKMFFPIMPQKVVKDITLFGEDAKGEMLQKMREIMSDEVIPDFLGGFNERTSYQSGIKSKEEGMTLPNTIQNSFITEYKQK